MEWLTISRSASQKTQATHSERYLKLFSFFVCSNVLFSGDKLIIEGTPSPAVFSWLQHVESSPDIVSHTIGRLLHGVLYSHLIDDNLYAAIELVELLAKQGDPSKGAAIAKQDQLTRISALSEQQQVGIVCFCSFPSFIYVHIQVPEENTLQPPFPVLENPVVRHLVVTLARIMAAYFSNTQLFVYPPHQPFRMPPLHTTYQIGGSLSFSSL
jgi:hypothetical protein